MDEVSVNMHRSLKVWRADTRLAQPAPDTLTGSTERIPQPRCMEPCTCIHPAQVKRVCRAGSLEGGTSKLGTHDVSVHRSNPCLSAKEA